MPDGLRILINEDSPSDAALLIRDVTRERPNARFEVASDRSSFAEAIGSQRFDLIISDFSLPGFNALDALEMTRAIDPDVPFIVVSGTIGEERAAELIRAGVTDYVMKGHLSRVVTMVDRAVREARERAMLNAAERQLVEAAAEWQDTVNAISEVILMLDADGRVRRTNKAVSHLPGVNGDSLVGMSWKDVLGRLCPETCVLPSLPEGQERLKFEWGPSGPDGEWFMVSYNPVSTSEENAREGFVMVLSDITQRKIAEADQLALLEQLRRTIQGSVAIAIRMVESRDPYTAGHQENVANLAVAIADELEIPGIDRGVIHMAGELHDIGKIAVPAEILVRPGRLDDTEWAIIRRHPRVAGEILADAEFGGPVVETVVQHHERLDGTGYPLGLKGDDIRLEARILAVADVMEAMTAHRPYRPAWPVEKAVVELEEGRGTRYDSRVVDACLAVLARGLSPVLLQRR